jgi:ArsR family transcriptional regulator
MDAMALLTPIKSKQKVDVDLMAESAREATEFLKALAHESRLLILCDLLAGEKSVGELEEFLSLRQSTVSQQLGRLRLEGLVAARRDGKTIHYSIANDKVRAVIGVLYHTFCNAKPTRAAESSART